MARWDGMGAKESHCLLRYSIYIYNTKRLCEARSFKLVVGKR